MVLIKRDGWRKPFSQLASWPVKGHQCDTVSGSSCQKDPGLWVVSTFPLTLALLRVLEMHSKDILFASCLKLSNNLWTWGLETLNFWPWPSGASRVPAAPEQPLAGPPVLAHGPLPAPRLSAQPQACRGSFWVTLGQSDLQKRRSVFQWLCQMPFPAGLPWWTRWVRAVLGLLVCVPLDLSPAEPRAGTLLITGRRKGKPMCASLLADWEKGQECHLAFHLCPGLALASPQPCWPSGTMEGLIGGMVTTFSWDTRPLQLLVNPN